MTAHQPIQTLQRTRGEALVTLDRTARLQRLRQEGSAKAILPGGAAQRNGLKRGDVIMSLNGRPVDHPTTLAAAIGVFKPGDAYGKQVDSYMHRAFVDVIWRF